VTHFASPWVPLGGREHNVFLIGDG